MKNFVKLFSFLMVVLVLTSTALAFLSNEKTTARSSNFGAEKTQAVYATHGKNVYWLTASIDEYENKPGNLTQVNYAK